MEETCVLQGLNQNHTKQEVWKLLLRERDEEFVYKLPTFILLTILLFIGLPGNVSVLLVYGFQFPASTTKYFIMTMAVFDLTNCALGIPFEIVHMAYSMELDRPEICKIVRFSMTMSSASSSFILVAVSVDRYRRICRPFKNQLSLRSSMVIIGLAIFVSLVFAVQAAILFGRHTWDRYGVTQYDCSIDDKYQDSPFVAFYNYSLFAIWVVCVVTLVVLYGFVIRKIRELEKQREDLFSEVNTDGEPNTPTFARNFSDSHTCLSRPVMEHGCLASHTCLSRPVTERGCLASHTHIPATHDSGNISSSGTGDDGAALRQDSRHIMRLCVIGGSDIFEDKEDYANAGWKSLYNIHDDAGGKTLYDIPDDAGGKGLYNIYDDAGGKTLYDIHDDAGGKGLYNIHDDAGGKTLYDIHNDAGVTTLYNIHDDAGVTTMYNIHDDAGGKALYDIPDDAGGKGLYNIHDDAGGKTLYDIHDDAGGKDLYNIHDDAGGKGLYNIHDDAGGKGLYNIHDDAGGKTLYDIHDDAGVTTLYKLHDDAGVTTLYNIHDDAGVTTLYNIYDDAGGKALYDIPDDAGGKDLYNIHGDASGKTLYNIHDDAGGTTLYNIHDDAAGKTLYNIPDNAGGKDLYNIHDDAGRKTLYDIHDDAGGKALYDIHDDAGGKALYDIHDDAGWKTLYSIHDDAGGATLYDIPDVYTSLAVVSCSALLYEHAKPVLNKHQAHTKDRSCANRRYTLPQTDVTSPYQARQASMYTTCKHYLSLGQTRLWRSENQIAQINAVSSSRSQGLLLHQSHISDNRIDSHSYCWRVGRSRSLCSLKCHEARQHSHSYCWRACPSQSLCSLKCHQSRQRIIHFTQNTSNNGNQHITYSSVDRNMSRELDIGKNDIGSASFANPKALSSANSQALSSSIPQALSSAIPQALNEDNPRALSSGNLLAVSSGKRPNLVSFTDICSDGQPSAGTRGNSQTDTGPPVNRSTESSLNVVVSGLKRTLTFHRETKTFKVTMMMLMVTVGFVFSFLPYFAIRIFKATSQSTADRLICSNRVYLVAHYLCVKSAFINSAINPIIYNIYNKSFGIRFSRLLEHLKSPTDNSKRPISSAKSFLQY